MWCHRPPMTSHKKMEIKKSWMSLKILGSETGGHEGRSLCGQMCIWSDQRSCVLLNSQISGHYTVWRISCVHYCSPQEGAHARTHTHTFSSFFFFSLFPSHLLVFLHYFLFVSDTQTDAPITLTPNIEMHTTTAHSPPCNSIMGLSIDRYACSLKESILIRAAIVSLARQAPLSDSERVVRPSRCNNPLAE